MSHKPASAKTNKAGKKESKKRPVLHTTETVPAKIKLIMAGLLLLTFVIYIPALKAGFINWDDNTNLLNNSYITSFCAANVKAFFTEPIQFMYTPLVYFTWALEYQIAGLNPFIYHFTNLLFHLANIVLVFILVRKLFPDSLYTPLLCSILFAVHPLNVEGVAWVTERINVLCAFFFLATLICYIEYIKSGRKWYILALVLFICSCLSKSSAVVLPVLLFLIDWFMNRKFNKRIYFEKILFFIVAIIIGIITIHFRQDTGNIRLPFTYNLFERLLIMLFSVIIYPVKALIPYKLSIAYAYPDNSGGRLPVFFYVVPFLLAAFVWIIVRFGKKNKVLIFGLLFYLIALSVNTLTFAEDSFISDRYAYLSLIGIFIIAANYIDKSRLKKPGFFRGMLTAIIVFSAIMAGMTFNRALAWKDTNTILSDAIEKEPNVTWTYNNRGAWRLDNGDKNGALTDLEKAVKLYANDYTAFYNLGNAKRDLKDFNGAIESYNKAISLQPKYTDAFFNRALVYYDLQMFQQSVNDFTRIIQLIPDNSKAYNSRGASYYAMKDYDKAITDFNRAIQLFSGDEEYFKNRSLTWLSVGNKNNACNDMQQALKLSGKPEYKKFIEQNCN